MITSKMYRLRVSASYRSKSPQLKMRQAFPNSSITIMKNVCVCKRCLLLGRKVMTNLDNMLKSRDITLSTKVHLVKAMVFPVVMHGCESWTIKKAECWRINAFELWCWRRFLRGPWTARRSNQLILTHLKRPWCWERLKAGGEGDDRDEMVG